MLPIWDFASKAADTHGCRGADFEQRNHPDRRTIRVAKSVATSIERQFKCEWILGGVAGWSCRSKLVLRFDRARANSLNFYRSVARIAFTFTEGDNGKIVKWDACCDALTISGLLRFACPWNSRPFLCVKEAGSSV